MTENQSAAKKNENPKPGDVGQAAKAESNLDDKLNQIDKILQASDPNFLASLSDIDSETLGSSLVLEPTLDEDFLGAQDEKKSLKSFLKAISLRLRTLKDRAFYFFKYWIKWFFVDFIAQNVLNLWASVRGFFKDFLSWSALKKLAFVLFVGLVGGGFFLIYKIWTQKYFAKPTFLFPGSFAEIADWDYVYSEKDGLEPLIGSNRIEVHYYLLKPFVINLKPSEVSTKLPMGYFEFFVEGNSNEALIEIKNSESLIHDRLSRLMETFTYEALETNEGKELLRESMLEEINSLITNGQVLSVRYQNIIIKP